MGKSIVEGKIDRVFTKDFGEEDQYGNQYMVNIQVDGEWYGLGKKKKPVANVKHGQGWHQLQEGDVIEAVSNSVERNGRTYNNIRASDVTVKEVASGGSVAPSGGNSSVGGNSNSGAVAKSDELQKSILRQSCLLRAQELVAATLTSKSDLDKAAIELIRLADDYLLPYAEHGLTPDEVRKQEVEKQNQQAAQQSDDDGEDFDDSLPF